MAGVDDELAIPEAVDVPDDAWTVAELNAEIETVLESVQESVPTYVVGEVADVSAYDWGSFFELRDIERDAVISCLAWSHARADFEQPLEEGEAAIVRARVDFYADQGRTQLVVSNYWPLGESDRTKALALQQEVAAMEAARQRAADLEQRMAMAYRGRVDGWLSTFERQLDAALQELEHAAETNAVTTTAARGRVGDLEARIDQAYRSHVEREVDGLEARIESANRDAEAEAKIEAGTAAARRLRVAVAVLLAVLVLGVALVILFLL